MNKSNKLNKMAYKTKKTDLNKIINIKLIDYNNLF